MKKGVKFDLGKLRYDLMPWFAEQEAARVYTIGAKKYGDNNWRGGFKWSRIIGAAKRHLAAFVRGEKYDPEDGQLHLSSLRWCADVLMEFDEFKLGQDDRVKYAKSKQKHAPKKKKMSALSDSISTPKKHRIRRGKSKRRTMR